MKLIDVVNSLQLKTVVPAVDESLEVTGGYASDMLSNAMGQAQPGQLWVTMQGHPNVAAVASLLSLAGVIVAGGSTVESETLAKAKANGVAIYTTALPVYQVCGKLYVLGIGEL